MKLHGYITNDFGMWYSKIYQLETGEFVLEEQSEMSCNLSIEKFQSLKEAVDEMARRT